MHANHTGFIQPAFVERMLQVEDPGGFADRQSSRSPISPSLSGSSSTMHHSSPTSAVSKYLVKPVISTPKSRGTIVGIGARVLTSAESS